MLLLLNKNNNQFIDNTNIFLNFLDKSSISLKKKKLNFEKVNNFKKKKLNSFRNYKKFFPHWYRYYFPDDKFKVYTDKYHLKLIKKFPYKRLKAFYWRAYSRYKRKGSKLFKKKVAFSGKLESRMNFFSTTFSAKARGFRFSRKTFSFLNFFLFKLLRKYFFLFFKSKKLFSLRNGFKFILATKIIHSGLISITNTFVSGILKSKSLNMKLNKYFFFSPSDPKLVTDILNRFYTGFRDRGVRFGQRFSSHLRVNELVFSRFFINLFFILYLNDFKSVKHKFSNSFSYFHFLKKKKKTLVAPKFLKYFIKHYKEFIDVKQELYDNDRLKYSKRGYLGRFKNLLGSTLVFIDDFIKDWWYEIEQFLDLDKINFNYAKIPYSHRNALTYKSKLIVKPVIKQKKSKYRRKSNRLTFFFNKLVPKFRLTRKFKSYFISKIGSLKSYMRFNKLKNYFKQKMTLRRFLRKYYQVPDSAKMYNRVTYVSSRPNKWRAFFKTFVGRLLFSVYWLGYAKDLIMSKLMIMNGLIMVNGKVCTNFNYVLENSDFISLKGDVFLLKSKKQLSIFKKCFTRLMQIQILKHLFFNHDYDTIVKRRSDINVNPFFVDLFKKKNYVNLFSKQQQRNISLINNTKLHQVLNNNIFFLKYRNLFYIELLPQSIYSFFNVFTKIENKYFNKKIFRKLAYRTYY